MESRVTEGLSVYKVQQQQAGGVGPEFKRPRHSYEEPRKSSSDKTENSMIDSQILQQQQDQEQQEHVQQQERERSLLKDKQNDLSQDRIAEGALQRSYPVTDDSQAASTYNSTVVATAAAAVVSHENDLRQLQLQQQQQQLQQQHLSQVHKPAVGTPEWHKLRRDNHKEVERRRRENINTGIQLLSELLPHSSRLHSSDSSNNPNAHNNGGHEDKNNKGQILRRAVQYIHDLKQEEASNIEKWTIEKLLAEQRIAELAARNDVLRKELEVAWQEVAVWKSNNGNGSGSSQKKSGEDGKSGEE